MKSLFLVIFVVTGLFAQQNIYEPLYKNFDHDEDNVTELTIQNYVTSNYNVSAYNANFFLPISYRFEDNFENVKENVSAPSQMEAEFQISIKYDIGVNYLGLDESYTVAYTQRSYWQLYVDSAYFRETNYNPEFFVTAPLTLGSGKYALKALRVGFAHMSNGRGGLDERSWNYLYTDMIFQLNYLFVDLKLWASPGSSRDKYNPDLLDYLGYGHLKFILPYKKHLAKTTFRYASKGYAAELEYSYPAFGRDDLFLYVKGFTGYGESLIDYDNKVNKLAIGFSISR